MAPTTTKLFNMADSVDVSALPVGMAAYAGYAGGLFANERLVVQRFPHALHKAVAVTAEEDGDILDRENGDALASQCPAWWKRQVARGVKLPGFYANASDMPEVRDALSAAKIPRDKYVLWGAHWDGKATLEEDWEAKQFLDHGPNNEHYDQSVFRAEFFGPPKPPRNPVHYEWFDNRSRTFYGRKFNERQLVERYDRLRKHPKLNRRVLISVQLDLLVSADRVRSVALLHGKNGKPDWHLDHLGWRRQQLIHRVQGQRFV